MTHFMHRNFLALGALLSGLAVAAGAFGAHGLQRVTTDAKIIQGYQTAVQYQFWHALALMVVAMLFMGGFNAKFLRWSAYCFVTGVILFSGSLYMLTVLKIKESGLVKAIGPVTPAGGLFFIAGWLILLAAVLRKK